MGRQHDRRTPSRGSGRLCHSAPLSDGSRLPSHGRQRTHKIGTQRETRLDFDLPHRASPFVVHIAWLTSGLRDAGFEYLPSTDGRIPHKHRQEHFYKCLIVPRLACMRSPRIGALFSRPVTKNACGDALPPAKHSNVTLQTLRPDPCFSQPHRRHPSAGARGIYLSRSVST